MCHACCYVRAGVFMSVGKCASEGAKASVKSP